MREIVEKIETNTIAKSKENLLILIFTTINFIIYIINKSLKRKKSFSDLFL